jgi:predicted amidohydrolase YtcJ
MDNARIRTMGPRRPTATRLGALHGRIVGLDEELNGTGASCVVDLGGGSVLPGFVDAHDHLAWTGLAAHSLDLGAA